MRFSIGIKKLEKQTKSQESSWSCVSHRVSQQGVNEQDGLEVPEVAEGLSYTDKLHGHLEVADDAHDEPCPSRAVELSHDERRDPHLS